MAFYEMEPWGGHYDDLRAGAITSMLANINRDPKKRKESFGLLDFITWSKYHQAETAAEPILLADPEEHSRLLESMLFPRRE